MKYINLLNKKPTCDEISFINYIINSLVNYNEKASSPLGAALSITSKCNLNCAHCWGSGVNSKKHKDPTTEMLKSSIKKLGDAKLIKLTISGGEPLIRTDFLEIIKYIKKFKIAIELLTNGTLINKIISSELGNLLKQNYDVIQISFDGPNEQTFYKQRNKNIFKNVCDNIVLLKKQDITIRAHFVATHINIDLIEETYDLAKNLGVDVFSIVPVYPQGKGKDLISRFNTHIYLEKLYRLLERSKKDGQIQLKYVVPQNYFNLLSKELLNYKVSSYNLSNATFDFKDLTNFLSINIDGTVYPQNLIFHEFALGNIYTNSMEEIYTNNKTIERLYNLKRELNNTKCLGCNVAALCKGGDIIETYKYFKHFNIPAPSCTL